MLHNLNVVVVDNSAISGTKLVKHVMKLIKGKYKYLLISTIKENKANEFYKKIGGKKVGECKFLLENKEYIENIYKFNI